MKPLRIALIGPSDSGKSELAYLLSKEFNLPLINNIFRKSYKDAEKLYPEDWDLMISKAQIDGLNMQEKMENKYFYTGFVSCRSVYDFVIYDAINGISNNPMLGTSYDALIYVPLLNTKQPTYDGFRIIDENFVEAERWGFKVLAELQRRCLSRDRAMYELNFLDPYGRLSQAIDIINCIMCQMKWQEKKCDGIVWYTMTQDVEYVVPGLYAMGNKWRKTERKKYKIEHQNTKNKGENNNG